MSDQRRKKRVIDANGKQLYDLTVEYLFHIQYKNLSEVKDLVKKYNLKWVDKCRTFNRQIVDPNPSGFRDYIRNKKVIKQIRKELSLEPPALNLVQRLFYFY